MYQYPRSRTRPVYQVKLTFSTSLPLSSSSLRFVKQSLGEYEVIGSIAQIRMDRFKYTAVKCEFMPRGYELDEVAMDE